MKTSLKYFSFYTDFFRDRRIRKLRRNYKGNGLIVLIYILCIIYESYGYYVEFDEYIIDDIITELQFLEETEIEEIIQFCVEIGIFDAQLFESHRILTSKNIQETFLEIMSKMRRKGLNIRPEYSLIEELERSTDSSSSLHNSDGIGHHSYEDLPKNDEVLWQNAEERPKSYNNLPKNSEVLQKNSEECGQNELDRKRKETRSKEISISLDKEKFLEIFLIEKNYPLSELEKFENHYSRTGWLDKNGNKIMDKVAAAKNWTMLNSQGAFFLDPKFHRLWKHFYSVFKQEKGFESALHVLHVKPKIGNDNLTFTCSLRTQIFFETDIETIRPILKKIFGQGIKLLYEITDAAPKMQTVPNTSVENQPIASPNKNELPLPALNGNINEVQSDNSKAMG